MLEIHDAATRQKLDIKWSSESSIRNLHMTSSAIHFGTSKARQSESESEQADQAPKANLTSGKGNGKAARNGKSKKAADCNSEQLVDIINNLSSDTLVPLRITAPMLLDFAPTGDRKPFELKSVMYDPEQLLRWKTRVATEGLVNMYKTVEQCRIDLTTMMFIIQTAYDGKVFLGDEDGDVAVLRAGKEMELLAEINMGASVYSTPVVRDGVMYLLTRNRLWAVQTGAQSDPIGN